MYTKQTWTNNDPATPISASRLAHIETGLESASANAVRVIEQPTWDVNAANNDAAFTSAIAAAVANGNRNILLPQLLKIANVNHVITPPTGLIGMGGGQTGAASTIQCTHANSRVSFGDQLTARFGGLSSGFMIDGNNLATNPLYLGIVASPVFLGVDVKRGTSINVLLEGTQNGYLNINSYNGATLYKIDRGAFTNLFPKIEASDASTYHVHFAGNPSGAGLGAAVSYCAHNVFDTSIFERAAAGNLGAVLHEAGLHNELRHTILAGTSIPTFIKMTKPSASPSAQFHLNNVSIENGSVASATGIDLAADCSATFGGNYLSLANLLNGIVYADSALVAEMVSPTFATVTNEYVGSAVWRQEVFRQNRRNGVTYIADDVSSYPWEVTVDGDARERLRIYGNGDIYRGNGSTAPVKILSSQGLAVANGVNAAGAPTQAEFNALVTQFNALLTRLRVTGGHGLIAD